MHKFEADQLEIIRALDRIRAEMKFIVDILQKQEKVRETIKETLE